MAFLVQKNPAPNLGRRAKLLAGNSVLTYGSATATQLIVTPIILKALGMELFGAWSIIRQILNYLNLADLRPFTGLKLTLALQQHVTDPEPKRRQIGASLVIWVITLPLMVGLACGLLYFSELLVPVQATHRLAVRWALTIALFGSIAATLFALPNNVLRGVNLDYKAMGLQAFLSVIFGLSCVLVVMAGWGLPGLAFAALLTPLVAGLVQLALARRYVPWFGVSMPQKSDLRDCAKINGWLLADTAFFVLVFSQDLVLAGLFLPIESAAVLALATTTARLFFDIGGQVLLAISPGVAGLWGSGEFLRIQGVRREIHLVALGMAAVGGAGYLLFNQSFLDIWVGRGIQADKQVLLPILLLGATQLGYRIEKIWMDFAYDFKTRILANIATCLVTLIFVPMGVRAGGLGGFLWCLAVPRILLLLWVVRRNGNRLHLKTGQPTGVLVRPLCCALGLVFLAMLLPGFDCARWYTLLVGVGLVSGIGGLAWIFVALPEADRLKVFSRLRHAF